MLAKTRKGILVILPFGQRSICFRTVACLTILSVTTYVARSWSDNTRTRRAAVDSLASHDRPARASGAHEMLAAREKEIEAMLAILRDAQGKGQLEERRECLYVLAKYRAKEAVPLLIDLLVSDPGPKMFGEGIDHFIDGSVAFALVNIGDAAVPALLKSVAESEDSRLREKCLRLLTIILGSRSRVADLLTKAEKEADDDGTKRRLGRSQSFLREQIREPRDPLY